MDHLNYKYFLNFSLNNLQIIIFSTMWSLLVIAGILTILSKDIENIIKPENNLITKQVLILGIYIAIIFFLEYFNLWWPISF